MCGLLAVYDHVDPPDVASVERGLESLQHRGPDATTLWRAADGRVVLGHKRLSFVDLTTGDQPVVNENGTVRAIVNGEFYDFETVRAALEARSHRFRSGSDSEILVHLYEEYGTDCVRHLRGEYAFVLWDDVKQRLFAGRDRFGIKPLFYAEAGHRLTLASEVKALHRAGVAPAWDEGAFLQTLAIGATLPDATPFKGVKSVPPGTVLTARGSDVRLTRYWDFDFPVECAQGGDSDADYAARFRALLQDAVRVRMRADVPLACYLSGGLDSCSILALMAQHGGQAVHAFTLGFEQAGFDETGAAAEMARHVGADLSLVPVTNTRLADNFSDSVWHAERLFFNAHGVGKYILSEAVRQAGYKGVLTGEGADEILAGYAHFRLDLLRHTSGGGGTEGERAIADANEVSQLLLLTTRKAAPVPSLVEGLGYVPAFAEPWIVNCEQLRGILPPWFDIDREYRAWVDGLDIGGQVTGRHPVNQSLYVWNKTALPGYMLNVLGDRMEMANSIEGRLPFLDHHLVEFTRTLPITQKINGTVEKFVLREAMRPDLPDAVANRQKHPFTAPPMLMDSRSRLFELLQDSLRGTAVTRVPHLDQRALLATLDRVPEMDRTERLGWEVPLTGILSSCMLAERFGL